MHGGNVMIPLANLDEQVAFHYISGDFNSVVKNSVEKFSVTSVIMRKVARFNALHWFRCEC